MPSSLSLAEEQAPKKRKSKSTPSASEDAAAVRSVAEISSPRGIALLEDIYEQNKKIKRRLAWMVFGSYFRLFLIIVPLVLSILYLPVLLEQLLGQYAPLLGSTNQLQLFGEMFSQFTGGGQGINLEDVVSSLSPEQLEQLQANIIPQ